MAEFRMPSLGADMESGRLVEWLKQPGDAVHKGDIVAVVETQKGAIEVEIFVNGVMGAQLVALGTTVPVGTPLALIEDAGAAKPTVALTPVAAAQAPLEAAVKPAITARPPRQAGVRASPAARKAAAERHLDLATIAGNGPDGAITLADVERAAVKPEARVHPGLDLGKMREAIAAAMAHSKRDIPHYYLSLEIDMARAVAWLEGTNAGLPPAERLLPAVLTLKAVALAVRKYPAFNGAYASPAGFTASPAIHAAPAIAIRGGGLVAPAIHDCDKKDLKSLMSHLRDLVSRARIGRLRSSEISDPTITVSSLGERGADSLFGVIFPPQVAIVGFGRITRKPVAMGDKIEIRPIIAATLAADHRVTDGHLGSLFLSEIASLLQEPEQL
jgi:pyruvate dehydrogenase E2 component (dihydrolipoyllysine-residue acetyltransferase)